MKENVILGKLIPAGTGYSKDRETSIEITKLANELKAKRVARNHHEDDEEVMSFITPEPAVTEDVVQEMIDEDELNIAEGEE